MNKFEKVRKLFYFLIESWRRNDRIEKLYFKKKWYQCIAECNKAIESEKIDFFVYYYLGLSNFRLNFLDESTDYLKKSLAFPESKKVKSAIKEFRNYAKYQIAVNFRKQQNHLRAIEQLDQSIQEDPSYKNFYYLKVNIYQDCKKTELAINAVSAGLNIDPKDKGLLYLQKQLAYSYSLEQSKKRKGG